MTQKYFIISLLLCASTCFAESVHWIQKPESQLYGQQKTKIAWHAQDFTGDFYGVCTFCPEELGPFCDKSRVRQQTKIFPANTESQFEAEFAFNPATLDGNYYATPYGYYNSQEAFHAEPILIHYKRLLPQEKKQ